SGIRDFHVTGVQTCALPISALVQEPTERRLGGRDGGLTAAEHAPAPGECFAVGGLGLRVAARRLADDAEVVVERQELGVVLGHEIGRAACREGEEGWADAGG